MANWTNLSNLISSIQKIMRTDAWVNGDAQRLEQLSWMLFLKLFDDKELIEVTYIKQIAEENNISLRTFVRAKKDLEIDSVRENNKWYWKY